MPQRFFNFVLLILLCNIPQGCAPVFSELQSARTAGKHNIEATPSFSSVTLTDNGNTNGVQNHAGLQLGWGLTNEFDLRLRYEYIWLKGNGNDGGTSVLGLGPKFGVVKDRLAFSIPVGRAFGYNSSNTWELHPTVLFTQPVIMDKLELTLSGKYLAQLRNEANNKIAFNLGMAVSTGLSRWAIRPEYGILVDPGSSAYFSHFSIGVTGYFGKED